MGRSRFRSPFSGDRAGEPSSAGDRAGRPSSASSPAGSNPVEETSPQRGAPSSDSCVQASSEDLLRQREKLIRLRDAWRKANVATLREWGDSSDPSAALSSVGNASSAGGIDIPGTVSSSPVHVLCNGAFPQSSSPPSSSKPTSGASMPTLAELGKQAKDTFLFPVDPSPKEMRQKAMAARFPFDSVTESSVKLKNTPIELR